MTTSFRATPGDIRAAGEKVQFLEVLIYAGPDSAHRTYAGVIVMKKDQAEDFIKLLNSHNKA